MVIELRQQFKLSQQLVMTPQLQQAIKLLQLSRLELADAIQQEIEQNPVLEELAPSEDLNHDKKENAPEMEAETVESEAEKTADIQMENNASLAEIDWGNYVNEYDSGHSFKPAETIDLPSRLDILAEKTTLQAHLQWQLTLSNLNDSEKEVGSFIIGNLDQYGFLKAELTDITEQTGCSQEMAQRLISAVQQMDPAGVGGRDVQESLLLQLNRLGLADSLAARIVRSHLCHLETKNYQAVSRTVNRPLAEIFAAVKIIIGLNPHPGSNYADHAPHYIIPDIYIYKIGDQYVIMLNDEGLPRLRVSAYYREILQKNSTAEKSAKNYVQEKLKSAIWLIKSIQQRQRTIYRVVESLLKFQKDFFEKGVAHLKPLILKDVAEDLEMHESTISRVTNSKYVHTPQGIFELKYFFNTAIKQRGGRSLASESIKERIRIIVQTENKQTPLSDDAITEIFKKEQITLARRTVAKYRNQLGILSSKLRKQTDLRVP